LSEVVAQLLIVAQAMTGYAPPASPPEVIFLPHAALERAACRSPCEVLGWYPYGDAIYLDDRLDPVGDVTARGILLHELVHYLQQSAGAFSTEADCAAWMRREREAYLVQARWLARHDADPPAPFGGPARLRLACSSD